MKKTRTEAAKEGHIKAEKSIRVVREFLVRNGWSTTTERSVSANGPDIVAIRGGYHATIEVKSASYFSQAWTVSSISRVNDTHVAIVFPNGAIHFDEMKNHLSQCASGGTRSLTAIGRILT